MPLKMEILHRFQAKFAEVDNLVICMERWFFLTILTIYKFITLAWDILLAFSFMLYSNCHKIHLACNKVTLL